MRGRRAVVVAVAAWVLVVAVGSTLVWAVISRAGEGVVAGPDAARPPTSTPPTPTPPTPTQPASTSPASTPPTLQPPLVRRGTWQGGAGVVVAECGRSAIRLVAAYPSSGWSVRVEDRGPRQVVVRFEGGEDRGETSLGARCVQGTPTFTATSGSGGGSGDG